MVLNKIKILAVLLMTSCVSSTYVKKSEIAVASWDEGIVFIKNTTLGQEIYNNWLEGSWGDTTEVILLDSVEFNKLYEKSYTSRRSNKKW